MTMGDFFNVLEDFGCQFDEMGDHEIIKIYDVHGESGILIHVWSIQADTIGKFSTAGFIMHLTERMEYQAMESKKAKS